MNMFLFWARDFRTVSEEKASRHVAALEHGPIVVPQKHYYCMARTAEISQGRRLSKLLLSEAVIGRERRRKGHGGKYRIVPYRTSPGLAGCAALRYWLEPMCGVDVGLTWWCKAGGKPGFGDDRRGEKRSHLAASHFASILY